MGLILEQFYKISCEVFNYVTYTGGNFSKTLITDEYFVLEVEYAQGYAALRMSGAKCIAFPLTGCFPGVSVCCLVGLFFLFRAVRFRASPRIARIRNLYYWVSVSGHMCLLGSMGFGLGVTRGCSMNIWPITLVHVCRVPILYNHC